MSNATTILNQTTVNTKPNDGMKNAMRWESLLNALLGERTHLNQQDTYQYKLPDYQLAL